MSYRFIIINLAVGTVALTFSLAPAAAVTIDAVYFAQTHVHQTSHPYFSMVGGKDVLIKAHVVDPATPLAPTVTATLTLGAQSTNITLTGPAILPASIPNGFGVVQHSFTNSFTNTIPKAWAKSGLTVSVQAGAAVTNFTNLKIGAPTKVIMTMLDVHYFAQASGNYPSGWEEELESKWPVADLELRRLRNVVFPELVIPPRGGGPAARIKSKTEYTDQTGLPFDGEQAAALEWNSALKRAAGTSGRISLYYLSVYGVFAGGQAGGFAGVGSGTDIGILNHELGHALSLPHWGDNGAYPYKGAMHGISAPAIYNQTHAGPVWAFDPIDQRFIPCTVQPGNVGGRPVGTYKCDPMQGGGDGFRESGYLMNHFSDYSVNQMRSYLEGHVLIWNTNLGQYASWNSTTKSYTTTVTTNGVNYPIERDVNVISILASVSGANQSVNMVYPPIGPYLGSLIRRFDPSVAADRTAAASIFAPAGGCDVCVRVVQGGVANTYMLAASWDTAANPLSASSLQTAAVNLRASDGPVTKIELLLTPDAQVNGLPTNPQVLYTWPGYLNAKSYYWDNNGAVAGFGVAGGIWADPTAGNAVQGLSTNATGGTLPENVTTTIFDDLNFGLTTTGLAAGTITVSDTVQANSLTFASGSGAITLTGGNIALGGTSPSITLLNQNDTINSSIQLLADATINAPDFGTGSTTSTLTLGGEISGSANLTFRSASTVANNSQQTILLNAPSSYTGSTTLNPAGNGANLIVKLGVDNALPPTTVLAVNGVAAGGSGRFARLELNGFDQTLSGLQNTPASQRTQQIRNSSATAATLTVNNSGNYAFSGRIESNLSLTKNGSGTLTLSGTNNSYTGSTTVSNGTLVIAAASLATNSTVAVGGAVLQLNFSTTNRVGALVLNGVTQPSGVYNSMTSAPFITGTGSLLVAVTGPSGPATLTNSFSGSVLSLSWPAGQGWRLQQQTNALNMGLSTNWVYVTDGSVGSTNITVNTTLPTVFYRLIYP